MKELTLIVGLLTTESSYKSEIERPSTNVEDTIQFCFAATQPWRIRTYAIDHDIHIHSIDGGAIDEVFAEAHIDKHYDEILKTRHTLQFKNVADSEEVNQVLQSAGLQGKLEIAPAGFAFYNPDRQDYRTQSEPD
jgi:hypothetical protein